MQNIKDFIGEYTYNFSAWGIVKLCIDVIAVCAIIGCLLMLVKKKISISKILIIFLVYGLVFAGAVTLDLKILINILQTVGFSVIFFLVIVYHQDIKYTLDSFFATNKADNAYSSKEEKEQIINTICSTAEYLSKKSIGALITFEREDSLSSIVDKAIPIDAVVTQELLTTIFNPGTACHDGGVIIRSNRVACAGAYYPATENFDVPKFLGTRHRAAIGISEKYDAITVIVSEETGNISLTISGNISLDITIERLQELLDGCLNTK